MTENGAREAPFGSSVSHGASPLFTSRSPAFRDAIAALERAASHDRETVLIIGESGTGKTILADYLHRRSPRRGKLFHRVSLASIADGLAASDLFGHIQGAFTDARSRRLGHFVQATGGTLFLDEIGKASLVVQHRLLDAIERQEVTPVGADRGVRVDVRIVAASNVCLQALAADGQFLLDLHARLESFTIHIPSLAQRREDIADLVRHFVASHAPALGYARAPLVTDELLEHLVAASWPRNLRQLDGAVRRILVDAEGALELTPRHWVGHPDDTGGVAIGQRGVDDRALRAALEVARTKVDAARKLGISRATLYRYMKDLESGGDASQPGMN